MLIIVIIIVVVCIIWYFSAEDKETKKTADNALGKAIYALGKVLKTILLK